MVEQVPEDITLQTLNELIGTLGEFRDEIHEENRIRNLENIKRDKRIRWSRILIVLTLVLGLVVSGVAVDNRSTIRDARHVAQQARNEAQNAAASLKRNKEQTRRTLKSSCDEYNKQVKRNRAAFVDNATILVAQVKHPTPEQVITIPKYIAAQKAKAIKDFPYRICTAKGIAAYFHIPLDEY